MANSYKILGQINPSANAITNVYVTDASVSAIVSSITITNLTDSNSSYSLIVRPINETLSDKHFIIRGGIIPTREQITIASAATMNSNVILAANTNNSDISFQAFGVEIT